MRTTICTRHRWHQDPQQRSFREKASVQPVYRLSIVKIGLDAAEYPRAICLTENALIGVRWMDRFDEAGADDFLDFPEMPLKTWHKIGGL